MLQVFLSFKTRSFLFVTALIKMDDDDLDEFEIEEQEAAVAAELDDSQTHNAVKKSLDEGSWFAIIFEFITLLLNKWRFIHLGTTMQDILTNVHIGW